MTKMKQWSAGALMRMAVASGLMLSACGPAEEPLSESQLQTTEQEAYGGHLGQAQGPSVATGFTCGLSNDFQPTCGSSTASDLAYTWTAPSTGTFTFTTEGSGLDTILEVRRYNDGVSLGCNDDTNGTYQSSVSASLTAGQTVLVIIDGYSGGCGPTRLNIQQQNPPPQNSDLYVLDITRDTSEYTLTYCNMGTAEINHPFTINVKNLNTSQSINFPIPFAGNYCGTMVFPCSLIGDSSCNQSLQVQATVDSTHAVQETDESNNVTVVQF